jgi:hypothetical protein
MKCKRKVAGRVDCHLKVSHFGRPTSATRHIYASYIKCCVGEINFNKREI